MKTLKFIFMLLAMLVCSHLHSFSQNEKQGREYKKLLGNMQKENWRKSYSQSLSLLKEVERDSSLQYFAGVLRYLNIMSVEGLMYDKKLSKEKAMKKVVGFKNKMVVLASHPIKDSDEYNVIYMVDYHPSTLCCIVLNKDKTNIFSCEYASLKKKITKEEFLINQGKSGTISGVLEDIKAGGRMTLRLKIIIKDAKIDVED